MGAEAQHAWRELPLADCVAAIIDYRGKTPKKTNFGVPLITAKVIKGGRIERLREFIASEDYDAWMRRGLPEAGDVVMTTEAPLGEVAQLDDTKVALAQRVITLRGKPGFLDNTYLKFMMQGRFVQEQLIARSSGTTVLGIKQSELRRVTLRIPPYTEQRAIAHILGTLDDKIELNRRMNETLEAMARALFKSWFVDFDPVRAKAQGQTPSGMDPATAALFPSEFEDSELGEIPKGWKVLPLDQVAHFQNGLALQRFRPTEDEPALPVVKIAQLRKGKADSGEWASASIKSECVIDDGDVVFSWSGSLMVVVWTGGKGALNQHLFKVTSETFPKWFYLQATLQHLRNFRSIAADKATTMGHIKRHHLSDALSVVPNQNTLSELSSTFSPLLERTIANSLEIRTLERLRDTLLPPLLSGELSVAQAEPFMAPANDQPTTGES